MQSFIPLEDSRQSLLQLFQHEVVACLELLILALKAFQGLSPAENVGFSGLELLKKL